MPSYAATLPAATALVRATEALSVAADALAAALDATPDDHAPREQAQPSARAWLTTALHAVAIAHDAANAAAR